MFFPVGTDRPQRRFPFMNLALIAANIAVYVLSHSFARRVGPVSAYDGGLNPAFAPYMLNHPSGLHLYQFITYQFLHADLSHIGFNMLFLYVFGNNLNEKLGHIGYLTFYLTGGVCAGIGQVLTSASPTLGASGAISATAGLFLVLLPRIHIRLIVWFLVYGDVWEVPSMYFILLKIAEDIFEQFFGNRGVAYMAHISGTAVGIAIGLLLLATNLVQRDHYDLLALLNRYRRRYEYRSIVAAGYDPYNPIKNSPVLAGTPSRSTPLAIDPRIVSLRDEVSRLLRLHESRDAAKRYLELRAIDPAQTLPPQDQIDVASQLMSEGLYAQSAAAYEDYLRVYPTGGASQQDQITLILGILYARYTSNAARAKELLQKILPKLHNPQEKELAESELKRLESAL